MVWVGIWMIIPHFNHSSGSLPEAQSSQEIAEDALLGENFFSPNSDAIVASNGLCTTQSWVVVSNIF